MFNKVRNSARRLKNGQDWKENGVALTLVGAGSSIGLGLLMWSTTL
ncbi:hypothetical protein [Hyphobacterium indicum]|nr:hypothetical protein [Hyphobacterium indicum]